jgi:hypothetical protein
MPIPMRTALASSKARPAAASARVGGKTRRRLSMRPPDKPIDLKPSTNEVKEEMMRARIRHAAAAVVAAASWLCGPARASDLLISTGAPDGLIATATRPSGNGKIEIETGDDFILSQNSKITDVSFTGLLTGGATIGNISQVVVEIYRVFPLDSTVPPSNNVPTRDKSPSDVAFDSRNSGSGLSFTAATVSNSFMAQNSVLNGINKSPSQFTGGEGAVTGVEATISTTLSNPFTLAAGHYFLVPQVLMETANQEFYWLSAPKPIVAPGTPFAPDLQTWIRNEDLAPDWLRVGTDITHQGPFNASFTIQGTTVPEPSSLLLAAMSVGAGAALGFRRRLRRAGA